MCSGAGRVLNRVFVSLLLPSSYPNLALNISWADLLPPQLHPLSALRFVLVIKGAESVPRQPFE